MTDARHRPGREIFTDAGFARFLGWSLLVLLVWVPLPLGSNRPLLWGVNAALLGALALVWAVRRVLVERPGPGISAVGLGGFIFVAYLGCIVFQVLPTGIGGGTSTLSQAPDATLLMALQTLSCGILYFLVFDACRHGGRRILLFGLVGAGALYALVGLVSLRLGDTLLGLPKESYFGSATGTFINRNSFATFLAFAAVLTASLLLGTLTEGGRGKDRHRSGGWARLSLLLVAFLGIAAALVATQSRMGVVAAAAGLVAVVLTAALASGRRPGRLQVGAGLGMVALVGLIVALNIEGVAGRFLSADASFGVRLALYEQVLELVAQRPLTGFGGGSFEIVFPLVHQPPVDTDVIWSKAHSTYLALWAELGIPAGSLPLLLLLGIGVFVVVNISRTGWPSHAAALGALVVAATHSLTDFSLEIQAVAFWFVALVAAGHARAWRVREDRRRANAPPH